MPELPEVETFKRYLDDTSLNQQVKAIEVRDERILNTEESYLRESIIGKMFESSIRHGKYLLVYLNPKFLVMHFGMSGDLDYYDNKDDPPKFSKVIFHFNNGFNLAYISIRMFGKVSIAESFGKFVENKKLGPDAYKMSFEEFYEAVQRRSAIAKNALLNQSFIAGVGNIYSDEILFRSKIHPRTNINSLRDNRVKELYGNIIDVLEYGIEKKGDLSTYPNEFLIPHRKKEEKCPICKSDITRYEVSGRHGFYCPSCQKES
ncbi:MAG: DNA-formamidopyrimidine glycosylase [Candidatus Lokiarchaeota archaeon]|nr:DNA-formamidopyrimidine glycosylase [Candidatus Lokiarchaeota archaeon]